MAGGASEHHEDVELLQLLLLWGLTYLAAFCAEHTRLSPLLFYILFGAILANFKLVPEKQSQFGYVLSELAITILFFALGLEESVDHFVAGIKKAWGIASIGAIVPFSCGYCCVKFMFDVPETEALMAGLAVTATAVSLTMIALKSEGLATSKPAMGVITSAVLDDIACLALVAIMVPLLTGEAQPTVESIALTVGKAIGFFVLIFFLHIFVLPYVLPPLIGMKHAEETTVFSLMWGLGWGCLAWQFSFHPAIGAYMAGLVLDEHYFDVKVTKSKTLAESKTLVEKKTLADADQLEKEKTNVFEDETEMNVAVGMGLSLEELHDEHLNAYHHTQECIEDAAFKWLGPLFFFNLGKKLIIVPEELWLVLTEIWVTFFTLSIGQILSAAFAAKFVPGGFTWGDSLMIGFGMLGRAELFFVVLDIGEKNGIISKPVFYTLVFAAMLMNISVPVTISLFKPFYVGERKSCLHHESHNENHDIDDHPEDARRESVGLLVATLHDKVSKREYSKGHRLRRPEKVVPKKAPVEVESKVVSIEAGNKLKRSFTSNGVSTTHIQNYSPPPKVKRSLTMGDSMKKSEMDIENGDTPQVVKAPTRSKEI
jgi:Kef-type K+ transport system membrane component KefB